MANYIIRNSAGGNARTFRWSAKAGMSTAALTHAVECSRWGGPVFDGDAADEAQAEFAEIHEQYLSGECSDLVAAIFQGH